MQGHHLHAYIANADALQAERQIRQRRVPIKLARGSRGGAPGGIAVLHASHSLSRRCGSSVRHFTSHYNDAVESYLIKLLIRITYLLAIYEIIGMLLAIFGVRSDFVVSLPNVRLPTVELTAGGGI